MLSEEQWNQITGVAKTAFSDPSDMTSETPQENATEQKGILDTIVDIGKGIVSGPIKEIENIGQTAHDIANFVDNKLGDGTFVDDDKDIDLVPEAIAPETGLGKTAQSISAFVSGWVSGGKLISGGLQGLSAMQKLAKASPWAARAVNTAVSGGVVDFISGDGSDERFADTLVENDIFRNAFTEYLAGDENDSLLEGRFKNVLEGFIVGSTLDAALGAFRWMRKGYKESLKGSLDASLAARKAAAAQAGTEGASLLPSTADEAVELIKKQTPGFGTPEKAALTQRAQAQQAREEIINSGKTVLEDKKRYFNTRTLPNEAAAALVDGMQDELGERITKDIPFRQQLYNEALDYNLRHNADTVFDKTIYLSSGALKETAGDQATVNRMMGLTYWIPEHVEKIAQNVAEGAPDAITQARQITQDVLEIVLDQKKLDLYGGHIGDAHNVLNWAAETGGKYKGTPSGQAVIGDITSLAKEAMEGKTDEEIVNFMRTYTSVVKNGANPKEIMQHIALLTPQGHALKKTLGVKDSKLMNSVFKFRYSAMLSSMKTQLRNITGNTARIPLMMFEEEAKAVYNGAIEGYKKGGLTGMGVGALHGVKEGAYFSQGLSYGLKQAKENFYNALKYGEAISRPSEYSEAVKATRNNVYGIVDNKIVSLPLRMLQAVDEFFATWTGTAKAYQQAMLDLKASGILKNAEPALRKELSAKWIEEYMPKAFADVVMSDGKTVHGALALTESVKTANISTYQQTLEGTMKKIDQAIESSTPLKFIFPFRKTPVNITKDWAWTRNPIVAALGLPEAIKSGDTARQAEALTHLTSAIILWTGAYNLVAAGKITGQGPSNKFQRNALLQTGWQPNSYRTEAGEYMTLDALEPFGSLLGMLATAAETAQQDDSQGIDFLGDLGYAFARTVTEKTFLKGLLGVMQSIDREKGGDVVGDIAISFMPSILRDLGQSIDPVRRATPDFYSKFNSRIPYRTDDLAPKYSWLTGRPLIYSHGGGMGAFLNAFNTSRDNGDALFYELSRLSGAGDPSEKIAGYKLSPHEYAALCETIGTIKLGGKTLYEALDEIISSESYQRDIELNPDPDAYTLDSRREEVLQKLIKQYQDAGKAQFLRNNPDLAQAQQPSFLDNLIAF